MPSPRQAPPRSDAQLLAAHAAGDRYAFAELLRRHHGQLSRLAHRTSRTPEDAADALQEALLSAHRRASSFRDDGTVSGWLHRIVVNACVDRLRIKNPQPVASIDDRVAPVGDHGPRVETALMVHHALMRLPEAQREAVFAVHMHGLSVAQAARLLGVAEGTVKSRCARGRQRLVELLGHRADADRDCA